MRTLLAALALGLHRLHAVTLADPLVGSWYIGGFNRLTPAMIRYAVIAAVASRPSESLSVALLEDDRAVMNIDSYEAQLREELEWVYSVDLQVFQLLGTLVGPDAHATALRTDCIDASHVSCAYIYEHFLKEVRTLPWRLAIGDIDANLDALAADGAGVEDSVSKKIRQLLLMKHNRLELKEAVGMFRQCRWSTALAEQLHGFAAVIHKLHREYGEETLTARTGCVYLRPLVAADPALKVQQKATRKLTVLGRRQPEKSSGQQAYIGEFVREGKAMAKAAGVPMSQGGSSALFAAGSKQWGQLGAGSKRIYSDIATSTRSSKRARLEEDKQHWQAKLALAQRRLREEVLADNLHSRLSSCRFTEQQRLRLNEMWQTLEGVALLRKAAMAPIDKPSAKLAADLNTVSVPPSLASQHKPQQWCKSLCIHRELFSQSALVVVGPDSQRAFAFMYAKQQPMDAILLPLVRKTTGLQRGTSLSATCIPDMYGVECAATFDMQYGSYVSSRRMHISDQESVFVLPGLVPSPTAMECSSIGQMVLLQDFLQGQPEPSKEQKPKTGAERVPPAVLQQHPWLGPMMATAEPTGAESVPSKQQKPNTGAESVPAAELSGDFLQDVANALAEKRAEHALSIDDSHPRDFVCNVRGGAWTMANKAVAIDSLRGEARTSDVKDWCKGVGVNMSTTCSYSALGEAWCTRLCDEWCRIMQYYYDEWSLHNGPGFDWQAIIAALPMDTVFEEALTTTGAPEVHRRALALKGLHPTRNFVPQ